MAPTPQDYFTCLDPKAQEATPPLNGESIVISGMSGLFPSSSSVKALSEILYIKASTH